MLGLSTGISCVAWAVFSLLSVSLTLLAVKWADDTIVAQSDLESCVYSEGAAGPGGGEEGQGISPSELVVVKP